MLLSFIYVHFYREEIEQVAGALPSYPAPASRKDLFLVLGEVTLMQTFHTKIFLTTSDPETAGFASDICGKVDKTKFSHTVSESSNNAQVGWLSGRTSSNKGSVSASKHYQKSNEPLFPERAFFELKNAQSIAVAFDGIHPLPATYCYMKPDFLPCRYDMV